MPSKTFPSRKTIPFMFNSHCCFSLQTFWDYIVSGEGPMASTVACDLIGKSYRVRQRAKLCIFFMLFFIIVVQCSAQASWTLRTTLTLPSPTCSSTSSPPPSWQTSGPSSGRHLGWMVTDRNRSSSFNSSPSSHGRLLELVLADLWAGWGQVETVPAAPLHLLLPECRLLEIKRHFTAANVSLCVPS